MQQIKVLILTDHSKHSTENSVYALSVALSQRAEVSQVDIASRGNALNHNFFYHFNSLELYALRVNNFFKFDNSPTAFVKYTKKIHLQEYDWIWLRLPRPIPNGFFNYLTTHFPENNIINRPSGIIATSTKAFLLKFPELCSDIQLINNKEELNNFKSKFPIVLKPLLNYGGQGILRIENNEVWNGNNKQPYSKWLEQQTDIEYLGMKFLKNVTEGDKRIIICHGNILAAVTRYPSKNSWMCNIAQGGYAEKSEVDDNEQKIIARIHPELTQQGIVMYGIDTLVDDNGQRVLSEVNTLSIGGIAPSGPSAVTQAIDGILSYIYK